MGEAGRGSRRAIAASAQAAFDRRLESECTAPLMAAFSGGGDSLALLLAAKTWADQAGRGLLAVTVDHRLQAAGADWAAWCRERAGRFGIAHETLVWEGDKPPAGLPAAARAARHGLIAEAARAAGARVVLMGHTADDRLEARAMRAAGLRVSDPHEWSPSPVWPRGRDIFILRPLLAARRAQLRLALAEAGETWIEDPANTDPRSPRARARAALGGLGELSPDEPHLDAAALLTQVAEGLAGGLTLNRDALAGVEPPIARAFVAVAVLCASGTQRPPRSDSLDRLARKIGAGEAFVATLAGARIEADGAVLRILREAGDVRRAGAGAIGLPVGRTVVWDGRFEIEARTPGLVIRPLEGLAPRLPWGERARLKAIAPAARRALPAVIDGDGAVTCPTLIAEARISIRCLVMARLAAACGAIQSEADLRRVAKRPETP